MLAAVDPAIDALVNSLKSDNPEIRLAAVTDILDRAGNWSRVRDVRASSSTGRRHET